MENELNGDIAALAEEVYSELASQYSKRDRVSVKMVLDRTKTTAEEYGLCCPPAKVLNFMENQGYLERNQREFKIL